MSPEDSGALGGYEGTGSMRQWLWLQNIKDWINAVFEEKDPIKKLRNEICTLADMMLLWTLAGAFYYRHEGLIIAIPVFAGFVGAAQCYRLSFGRLVKAKAKTDE